MKENLACLVASQTRQLTEANSKLLLLSLQDGLTGVANRRHLDEHIVRAAATASAEDTPLSLLMIDLDHFKVLNDTLGHQRGDECLRLVAEILKSRLPDDSGFLARYGGEEYVVELSESPDHHAMSIAESMVVAIRDAAIPNPAAPFDGRLTVSIGVASLKANTIDAPNDLLSRADQALYEAKRNGRNQAVFSSETGTPLESQNIVLV